MGVKRGVFANEAGLGSAPNVAAVASVKHPGAQGVVQAFSVFLDTFVICTCTALLILLSGFYTPGFEGDGIVLTQNSLAAVVGDWGRMFVSVALSLFVFTCDPLQLLPGREQPAVPEPQPQGADGFRALVLALVVWGSMQNLSTVFAFADITMTCLAFVNLMALACCSRSACASCATTTTSARRHQAAGVRFQPSSRPGPGPKAWPTNPPAAGKAQPNRMAYLQRNADG
jgi:AGCS family alanine or glycine:cation symporter